MQGRIETTNLRDPHITLFVIKEPKTTKQLSLISLIGYILNFHHLKVAQDIVARIFSKPICPTTILELRDEELKSRILIWKIFIISSHILEVENIGELLEKYVNWHSNLTLSDPIKFFD